MMLKRLGSIEVFVGWMEEYLCRWIDRWMSQPMRSYAYLLNSVIESKE